MPQVGHLAPPQTQTRRPTAAVSKPPRMTLPPPPTRLVELDDQMDREQDLIQWSEHESLDDDYDDEEQEPHPFAEVPGLEDCPLSGLRSALTRTSAVSAPTSRQTALWTQSRGGTEVRNVRTYRIDNMYSGPDGADGSTFKALELPSTLPLTQQQWQADSTLKKQQNLLGRTACALSRGLETMEALLENLTRIADTLPADTRARMIEEISRVQSEALAPIGRAMRFLASGFNDITFRRHDAVVTGIRDPVLQQQVKNAPLGMDQFFRHDVSSAIASATDRQQQNALTAALRHKPASTGRRREQDRRPRSRSPMRRDRDSGSRSRRPFKRGSSRRGGTSRGGRGGKGRY